MAERQMGAALDDVSFSLSEVIAQVGQVLARYRFAA